jgi:hypothetical protein
VVGISGMAHAQKKPDGDDGNESEHFRLASLRPAGKWPSGSEACGVAALNTES